jgi:4-hydroxybenzoate polyprenyltransferase
MSVSPDSDGLRSTPVQPRGGPLPLCVDLDGTVILSDLLFESLILLVKRNPFYLLRVLLWLVQGRATLEAEIAARVTLDPGALPYNRELLAWLESEHCTGRRLWLCAASNEALAACVASHLGFFEGLLPSDRRVNLIGGARAARLVEHFGSGGFDYCGNAWQDIAIWKEARGAIVVRGGRGLQEAAARHVPVLRGFPLQISRPRTLLRALRPHQWAKNGLLLVPLLAAHHINELSDVAAGLLAVLAFCLCASSVYVLNDLLDLETDRRNPRKSQRPFAAGLLSLRVGCVLVPVLFGLAFTIAMFLPLSFAVVLTSYYTLTLTYSFALKGLALIDALVLAALYTLRIVAGAAAVNVPLSFWMLLFSVFLFLSLAFVKRFAELDALRRQNQLRAIGRDYEVGDLSVLQSLGSAAGYLSVLVLALYINSPEIESLYRRPKVIWVLCVLLLFWISRVWMLAQRGAMHNDPVLFALKDRASLAVGVLVIMTVALAL